MNKKKIIIFILMIVLIIISIIFVKNIYKGKILYSNSYGFDMGSLRIKVYTSGRIEHDREIEDPIHKVNYEYYRTLSKNELKLIEENISDKNYIYKIIYNENYSAKVGSGDLLNGTYILAEPFK